MDRPFHALATAISLLLVSSVGFAAEPTPAEILKQVDAAAQVESSHMLIAQTIETTRGDKRTFTIESWSANGGEKSVMRFIAPPPSKGIGMLAHDHGDNIWAYFPDSDDLRKIASSARKQSMQGSDFSYEDMSAGEFGRRYRATKVATEELDGKECWKLELVPTGSSTYKRVVIWVDRDKLIPYRAFHYNQDSKHIKTLVFSGWKKVKGTWTPFTMTMKNLERGSQTVIEIKKLKYNLETDDSKFTTHFLTSF